MILSLFQIDFIDSAGTATRLLSYGEVMEKPFEMPWGQSADEYSPISATWGLARAKGGGRRTLEWTRRVTHASHAEVCAHVIRHPASLPSMKPGKIRVSIQGGEVWDSIEAVLLGATTRPHTKGFASITTYRATAGQSFPVSGLAHYAGMPTAWMLTTHSAQALTHSNL